MTDSERQAVAVRAKLCCEYCQSQQTLSHDDFAVDHIFPRALGGDDELSNLALCCQGCNSRKQDATEGEDPLSGAIVSLFHPRRDVWRHHFAWSADYGRLEGLTSIGRATVIRLDLNRPYLVNLRIALAATSRHPPV